MKINYKIIINFLALIGFISLCLITIAITIWSSQSSDINSALNVPLNKNLTSERYFKVINDRPLVKSDIVWVVNVKILKEGPKSATLQILYDSKNSAPLDDVWVSAVMLQDSGWPLVSYYIPTKALAGHGKTAIVELGLSDEEKSELLISNAVIINFYKNGQMPFHEEKYEYQRVWCRSTAKVSDFWKRPYPAEKGSKYSINGPRSISRLCLE